MFRSHTRNKKKEESFCPNLFFRSSYFTRSKLLLGSDGHEEDDDDDDDDDDGDNDVVVVMIMRMIMLRRRSRSMKKMRIMMI